MPLSINFRWKTPTMQAPQTMAERTKLNENLTQLGKSIADMKASRYRKEQDARRNAIEDEDRKRRMAEEDRRIQAYKDSAELIRNKKSQRDALVAKKAQLEQQIAQLKAQLGG